MIADPTSRAGAVTGRGELRLEEALAAAIATAPVGIAVLDARLRFLLVNVAMAELTGTPVEGHLGRELSAVLGARSGGARLEAVLRSVLDTGTAVDGLELELDDATTGRRVHRAGFRPVMDGGRVTGVCAFLEDQTGPRLAEEQRDLALAREHAARLEAEERVRELVSARAAVAKGEAQLRAVADVLPGLIALVGKDRRYRFANATYQAWFGVAPEQVVGRTMAEVMGPDVHAAVDEHVTRALGGARVTYEARIPYPTGARLVRTHLLPLELEDGAVDGFVALVQDVSGEHRVQERLQFLAEASRTLTASLDHARTLRELAALAVPRLADWCAVEMLHGPEQSEQLAVAHVDPARVELAWELRRRYPLDWAQRVGLPEVLRSGRSELYESIPEELLAQSTVDAEHLRIVRTLGLRSAIVVPLATRGRILGAITLVQAESGRRYDADDLALAEELASRAALAVDNARLYEEAQDAIRKRDEFLSVASHELRTPLTSLKLTLAGLEREAARMGGAAGVQERLRRLDTQTTRLGALVDQLLDVSRLSAGRLVLEPSACELVELAREVVERFDDEAGRLGTSVTLVAAGPVRVRADRQRVDQVLTNLVANALKYGAATPVTVEVRAEPEGAVLTVADGGPGISPEERPRVFQRFERGRATAGQAGMGLGLWIVRELVLAHGGSVALETGSGPGARFRVQLPRGD